MNMSQSPWQSWSLERIPDEVRHQLDELLFTPAWDNVDIVNAIWRSDIRTVTGEQVTMARLKYHAPAKIEVIPRLFQRRPVIKIRADILNKPYLVLYPWHKHQSPPPCVRLMNAMLAQRISKPAAAGAPQMCIAAPQSIILPPPGSAKAGGPDAEATAAYIAAANKLPLHQRRRLADALFMHATAMHLFQMHSALPPPALSAHITRDRLVLEYLATHGAPAGHVPRETAAKPHGAAQGRRDANAGSGVPGVGDDPMHDWCEDYRTILKLSTVFPLKLQRHHELEPAERPGLAAALLRRWTAGSSCLRHGSDRRVTFGLLPKSLDLTAYSDWSQVPPAERADVQPLCMHPRTLAEAVIQLHANKAMCAARLWLLAWQYFRLRWDGLRPVMLSVSLAQGFAALACSVNEALVRYHVDTVDEATYV